MKLIVAILACAAFVSALGTSLDNAEKKLEIDLVKKLLEDLALRDNGNNNGNNNQGGNNGNNNGNNNNGGNNGNNNGNGNGYVPAPQPAPVYPSVPVPQPAPVYPTVPAPQPAPVYPSVPAPQPAPAYVPSPVYDDDKCVAGSYKGSPSCAQNGNLYTPVPGRKCSQFTQEPGAYPLPYMPCPYGLMFDTCKCVCNYPYNTLCPN